MNLIAIIRTLFYALFFLAPLVMSAQTSEIFEFNKMILIYFFSVVIGSVWLIDVIWYKRTLRKSRIFFVLGIFLLSQIISTVFSIDKHTSVFGYYGRFNGGLLSMFSYATLLLVFLQIFTKEYILKFLKISMLSSVVVMVWGLLAKVGADFSCLLFTKELTSACWTDQFQPAIRMFSTLGQPNWLGAYLAIHTFLGVFFTLSSLVERKEKVQLLREKLSIDYIKQLLSEWNSRTSLYAVYTVLTVVCIYFTKSRSSLLAVAIGFMVMGYVLLWKYNKKFSQIFIGAIVFVLMAIIFYIATIDISTIQQTAVTESFDIRKVVWKGAVDVGLRYPLFGTGVETFAYSYYFARPVQHNLTSEWDFLYNKAHNEFLNYFATTGFIGLIAYMLLIGYVCWHIMQKILGGKNASSFFFYSSLLGAYTTIHVTNFFGFATTTVELFFFLIPALIDSWGHLKTESVKVRTFAFLRYGGVFVVSIIGMYLSIQVMSYHRADTLYAAANRVADSDYQGSMQLLDQALQLHYEHVYEDKLSASLATLAYVVYAQSLEDQSNTKVIEDLMKLSNSYNQKTLVMSSQNVLYWKTSAKNNYVFYDITKDHKYMNNALQALEMAQKLSPTDPKLLHSEALFYSILSTDAQDEKQKEQYRLKAIAELDKALTLKPGYAEALEMKKQITKQDAALKIN